MPFYLDKDSGLPLRTVDNGDGTVSLAVYTGGGVGGVSSIAVSGSSALTGAVTLSASGSVLLFESGQNIIIYSSAASGSGGSYSWEQESLSGSLSGGNTIFVLSHTPAAAKAVVGSLGGVSQAQGTDYTMAGPSATFTGDVSSQSFLAIYPY